MDTIVKTQPQQNKKIKHTNGGPKDIFRLEGRLSHNGGEQPSINLFNTNALRNQIIPVDPNVLSPFHVVVVFFSLNKTTKNE